ncbi:relaxase/mobilization nuclease domain-containing protein [Paracoccus aurantiacus]|uniref:relaxase/mobilization nuclease domain-containing protein n=1 Tax=Paracoccus aurantiacus TaxID=2599412 RepID=UPI0036363EA9
MTDSDREFRIRPGKPGSTRAPRAKSFINQVLRAAQKAGHVSPSRSGAGPVRNRGSVGFGRGSNRFGRSRIFAPTRRVVVAARIARHKGRAYRSAPLTRHLAYLKREGVSREGEKGLAFDAASDRADDLGFAERCEEDRHHFRFIVSPEDVAEMADLKGFTRDLVKQMEADLGTKLDWVAVDHWNTDNPHVHLLVRGVDDQGGDLVISRDYISSGLRSRAEDLVALELGPKPKHEIHNALEREVTADRWTRIDREIQYRAGDLGLIDLRPEAKGPNDPELRRLMIGRLQHLRKMGLAAEGAPGEWMVGLEAEQTLRDLGTRGDIIKTMHRAFAVRGEDRGVAEFATDGADARSPIIGRLVEKGLHNELTGEAYAVIDGTDGRAHHVRFRGIEAFDHAPPEGGIVELRRFGGPDDPRPTLVLANRSDLDLQAQITAPGATWLDHRLVERDRMPLAMGGFGQEVREAMEARADHLINEGFAKRQGQRLNLQRNLLSSLRRRELDKVGEKLAEETGLPHHNSQTGEHISGTYRRQVILSSGRYAMIEGIGTNGGPGFQLVPWSREIEKRLGQHVSGIATSGGGIDWSLGRKRGLGI